MTKPTKKEIQETITRMAEIFQMQAEEKHRPRIKELVNEYGEALLDPEKYHLFVEFPNEEFHSVMIHTVLTTEQMVLRKEYSQDLLHRLTEVFTHYDLLEQHLDRLVVENEGMPCSADKTRFLVTEYMDYLKTEEMPIWKDRNQYWIPNYGSEQNWMHFIQGTLQLAHGIADDYISFRGALLENISADVDSEIAELDSKLIVHPNYLEQKEHEKGTAYYFNQGDYHLMVVIQRNNSNGYILTKNEDGKSVRVHYADERPEWVEGILEII